MKHGREAPSDCPKNTQWYHCYNGFVGCCSVDVCTKGSCPDKRQDSGDFSSSSSAANPTTTTRTSSGTTSTSTNSTSSIMSSDDSSSLPAFATTTVDKATSTAASSSPSSSSSTSASKPTSSSPSVMSDRVATRTVPNDSTVTVTRHTTITQELPTTTADPTASSTTDTTQQSITSSSFEIPSPTAPSVTTTTPPKQSSGGINTGVVVGIAVGGAFAVALIAVLIWLWRSRRRNRGLKEMEIEAGNESMFVDKTRLHESIFGGRPSRRRESATLPRHPTPHQASEQGYGYDPFAPFGGRTDRPEGTSPPPIPNTFEMDGRGVQVIELPDTAVTTGHAVAADGGQKQEIWSARALKHHPSHDPRATLNHLPPRENGQPTYINQWNQFKGLATDSK